MTLKIKDLQEAATQVRLGDPWAISRSTFHWSHQWHFCPRHDFSPNCLSGGTLAVRTEMQTLKGLQWMYIATPTVHELLKRTFVAATIQ